ncbi:MAG: endonuclease [Verrucomicrobia bacterium]|nr:MAG: endonuclease [Verrucomicrobiota bacterium]
MRDLSPRTLASSKRTRVTPARLHCVIGTVTLEREDQRTDRLAARVANVAASHAKGEMTSEPTRQRLRVATYNVHGCVGMDAQRSEDRIAEVIASMSADIVGLQELDLGRPRSSHADQMRSGEEQYGNAIVSRFPIELKRAAEMPGTPPWYCREQRIAIWTEAQTDLGPVHIINSHFGLGRSERRLQAQLLVGPDWIGSVPADAPAILLGDFNSVRTSRAYRLISSHLRDVRTLVRQPRAFRTFPTRLPSIAVDHIFVNAALSPIRLNVHRTPLARQASDHFPLVCELTLTSNSSSAGSPM